jgi:ribosomal protein L6P/L9E
MITPAYSLSEKICLNTIFFKPLKNHKFEQKKLIFNSCIKASLLLQVHKFYLSNTIFTFVKQKLNLKNAKIINLLTNPFKFFNTKFFSKYFYNGLGYKIFLRKTDLFIWVGLTHYTILRVPDTIKVFPKKRRIFIVGTNLIKFKDFLMQIRRIRKIDLYKGKGLLEVKTYKGFIKMKSGKKKQY